ncbi:hypothetical protein [Paraburkholderia hospita]|uniref:MFS transporter n=1 Tax=Paraburkholderia hospita TaxID=169430 RepID=A0AAN1JGX6_9BURK|nr:hypothetical protein [Paraburkholderia hospita]AUT73606.1 MFS transporter [Paraburkholderia hospita]EIM99114.1 major facilitator superfamily protein [Paraburkholderia hospita]OUL72854.1 MFS transporter [Paraburkholderia hospita]OUL97263.1 MFS transporter [Paraburkholderia hospita]SEH73682.1 MFS transporter, MHS family, metabolite:H+ symporter [Paraburkholderia hospita]
MTARATSAVSASSVNNARYRYTGIAVSEEFTAVAAGGIAPFIAAALLAWAQGAYWPIATYIAVLAGISFVATFFSPETRGISRRQ